MPTQPTASLESWPEEATARNGTIVAGGYGVRVNVWRGRLRIDDGIGTDRRRRLFHRATSGVDRLVVLGHTGYVSLDAFRWLADIKASYAQIDADGRVLATFGPPGTDRPNLRRAQAIASQTELGLELSRRLVKAKLDAQIETLRRFASQIQSDEPVLAITEQKEAIDRAATSEELRIGEAWAAAAYWQALAPLEVRFAARDRDRVPAHWWTFGGRNSPLANGPRLAANPANALINYLAALLEAEATLAARTVGLDPGLGLMHVDQPYRDSLACDLMEPIRPVMEAHAFEILTTRPFAARDFFETRAGVCRVTPPLTHELAETAPRWGRLVGKVAEDFAAALERPVGRRSGAPTPITERRRSQGRPGQRPPAQSHLRVATAARACSWCGGGVTKGRSTCNDECAARIQEQTLARMAEKASERMRELARKPGHPALSAEANEKRRETRRKQRAEELAWEREHPEPVDRKIFQREIWPGLANVRATELARATGLSVGYWAEIKHGKRMPHPRWWETLRVVTT